MDIAALTPSSQLYSYFRNSQLLLLGLLAFFFSSVCLRAQPQAKDTVEEKLLSHKRDNLQEKLFLHLDRSFYVIGETIWFKIYSIEGSSHHLLNMSKVAYVELLDRQNGVVCQAKIALENGVGQGHFNIPAALQSGTYWVRSYTSWMKNFSPDFFFYQRVAIANPFELSVSDSLKRPSFSALDIQFFPEGGDMVLGLESKIAFRAVDDSGKGVDFAGFLLNQNQDTLVRFKPEHFGIGTFMFRPQPNERYHVLVRRPAAEEEVVNFPESRQSGYVMRVDDSGGASVKIVVLKSIPMEADNHVYLLAHTRLQKPFALASTFENGKAVFTLDKSALGDGISHFTIFDPHQKPVLERLYFKRPASYLSINGAVKARRFRPREKVDLDIHTTINDSIPQSAHLSVSVHWLDSLDRRESASISEFLWLTSDLKGGIESPGYYLQDGKDRIRALDNLMLTHGWLRFRWENVLASEPVRHQHVPEYGGHFITGKITNRLSRMPESRVASFLAAPSVKPMLYSAVSERDGGVRYEMKFFSGTKEIVIQTNTNRDSTSQIEIDNPFSGQYVSLKSADFLLRNKEKPSLLQRSINMQVTNSFIPKSFLFPSEQLNDSLGFFGVPDARYFLDDYTRFPTMEEVMREYVPGVSVRERKGKLYFRVADKLQMNTFFDDDPLLLLDGIPVFDVSKIVRFDPLKIKKLEVVTGRYFFGPLWFPGIISLTTYKGDMGGFELDPGSLVMQYDGVQNIREFYSPRYDLATKANSRIPDYRNLLYWEPTVITNADGKLSLSFYSSDLEGTFRVEIQGMTKNGLPGTRSFLFEVGRDQRQ